MFNSLEKIRTLGDPVLKSRCAEVTEFTKADADLAHRMSKILRKDQRGIGLAANQIGVKKRIVVVESGHIDIPEPVLVNPVIEDSSDVWEYEEGCMSIPGFYFPIKRPKLVSLKAQRLDGSEFELELDVIEARLMLHEIDHLDGKCMFDIIPKEDQALAQEIYAEVQAGMECRTLTRGRNNKDYDL
jgi:peptide deformylase